MLLKDVIKTSWEECGKPQRVLVAFSGGADSTALLVALHRFSAENAGIPCIWAHHVHHGLRANADSDAAFCETVCKKFSIPFSCSKVHLSGFSENEARTLRYEALFEAAARADADTIALAHHLHDQTETMLMRLMRGTAYGLKGISVMSTRENGIRLWRPFLSVSPEYLRKALLEAQLSWQEDESNSNPRYLRNLLRQDILPLMRSHASNMDEHFYQASLTLQEENAFLGNLADDFLQKHGSLLPPCPFLDALAFSALHPAMKKRVLHAFFLAAAHLTDSPDRRTYDACAAIKENETVNLPDGRRLFHAGAHIHLVLPGVSGNLSPLAVLPFKKDISNGIDAQSIPKSVYESAVLRTRQPGDFIIPFGMNGKKSLQDYLTDKKVDRPFRDHLPLLCKGQEVLWVIGVGASEKMRAHPDDSMNVLLHYPGRLIMNTPSQSAIQEINTKEF